MGTRANTSTITTSCGSRSRCWRPWFGSSRTIRTSTSPPSWSASPASAPLQPQMPSVALRPPWSESRSSRWAMRPTPRRQAPAKYSQRSSGIRRRRCRLISSRLSEKRSRRITVTGPCLPARRSWKRRHPRAGTTRSGGCSSRRSSLARRTDASRISTKNCSRSGSARRCAPRRPPPQRRRPSAARLCRFTPWRRRRRRGRGRTVGRPVARRALEHRIWRPTPRFPRPASRPRRATCRSARCLPRR
mmetsp:Transcript_113530/g.317122  ORF Transcript_113530/g.317122 Transcript_113530/m.317122 type:complete len:246 (-) Transcript_113530:534-1271(-)